MRKLVIGAALAMLFASPAFAQSYSGLYGTGNIISPNDTMKGRTSGTAGIADFSGLAPEPASDEHLSGVRAEAPKAARHRQPVSQQ